MLAVAVRIRSVTTAASFRIGRPSVQKKYCARVETLDWDVRFFVRVACSFPWLHVSFGFLGLHHHERG